VVREKEYLSAMLDACDKGMRGRLAWMGECVLSHVFSAVEQFGRGCSSRRQIRAVMQLSSVGHRFNYTVELFDDYATSTSALPFEKFLASLHRLSSPQQFVREHLRAFASLYFNVQCADSYPLASPRQLVTLIAGRICKP
jgi:hypothetical protein